MPRETQRAEKTTPKPPKRGSAEASGRRSAKASAVTLLEAAGTVAALVAPPPLRAEGETAPAAPAATGSAPLAATARSEAAAASGERPRKLVRCDMLMLETSALTASAWPGRRLSLSMRARRTTASTAIAASTRSAATTATARVRPAVCAFTTTMATESVPLTESPSELMQ